MPQHPKVFLGFDYYVPAVHRGVVRAARELGWHLQTNAHDRRVPLDRRFDGLILQFGSDPALDALALAHPGRVVDITRRRPDTRLHRVYQDPAAAGELAAEFLLKQGHGDFAVLEGGHWADPARCDAFVAAIRAAGRPCRRWKRPRHAEAGNDTDALAELLREKLNAHAGPLAVFCMHDAHAALLLRVAHELGVTVPGKLCVLGCDDEELLCEATRPPLSSINLNFETVGHRAALRLDALMRGDCSAPRETGVPPSGVTERLSTGALRSDNPRVRAALELIERAGDATPQVESLARAAGVNRRTLERAFRETLGCSPLEVIIRHRVERAARLMREHPSMSGPRVAERLGYRSLAHFYRQFSQVKGVPVDEFRRRHSAAGLGEPSASRRHL